jgi:hypothetical protein
MKSTLPTNLLPRSAASYGQWVIFREDPNTHREVYMRCVLGGVVDRVSDVADARVFPTARAAYAFGAQHECLEWWHVGQR